MNKLAKILIALSVAVFFTVTVINNVADYQKTFQFTYHTLSMDTTAQNPVFMWRAITSSYVQHVFFISIIIVQLFIALLCWWSVITMLMAKDLVAFHHAKSFALLGSALAFVLYALGFITIAGQWFMMRESTAWNVQPSVHAFLTFFGVSLIFLCLRE